MGKHADGDRPREPSPVSISRGASPATPNNFIEFLAIITATAELVGEDGAQNRITELQEALVDRLFERDEAIDF